MALLHGVSIVEGFDPLILKEYDSLLQLRGIGMWSEFWPVYVENNMILSLLNTRYIILPPEREIIESAAQYKKILTNSRYLIYENMNVLPRAFSVSTLIGVDKFETIKAALFNYQINPVTDAMVSVKDLQEIKTNRFTQGNVSLFDYTHRMVSLKTTFMEKGFVVLSDQYYPGWKAFIDKKPVKIYKTNGTMRGVIVPPGEHELVFQYWPRMLFILIGLSILTSSGMIMIILKKIFTQK
jgi:uncharacterized membrane protein YfhO